VCSVYQYLDSGFVEFHAFFIPKSFYSTGILSTAFLLSFATSFTNINNSGSLHGLRLAATSNGSVASFLTCKQYAYEVKTKIKR